MQESSGDISSDNISTYCVIVLHFATLYQTIINIVIYDLPISRLTHVTQSCDTKLLHLKIVTFTTTMEHESE